MAKTATRERSTPFCCSPSLALSGLCSSMLYRPRFSGSQTGVFFLVCLLPFLPFIAGPQNRHRYCFKGHVLIQHIQFQIRAHNFCYEGQWENLFYFSWQSLKSLPLCNNFLISYTTYRKKKKKTLFHSLHSEHFVHTTSLNLIVVVGLTRLSLTPNCESLGVESDLIIFVFLSPSPQFVLNICSNRLKQNVIQLELCVYMVTR